MRQIEIEPGLLRTFRLFAGLESLVFLCILIYYWASERLLLFSPQSFYFLNLTGALFLLGYLSWAKLIRWLGSAYLPLALTVSVLLPVVSSQITLNTVPVSNVTAPVINAWQWMPMLFVPLVMIAWQYDFRAVFLYCLATGYVDLSLVLSFANKFSLELVPVFSVSIIRTISFIVVGYAIVQLMHTQREQRRSLLQANAQLAQHAATMQQLATSRERNRLARELHDTLAHTLSGLAVNLEALKTVLVPAEGEVQIMLDQALTITRSGLIETRRALKDLRATQLDDLGLTLALENLIAKFSSYTAIPVQAQIEAGLGELPIQVEHGIYRVTQEALENITRHAGATRVTVTLRRNADQIELSVEDNGKGFIASAVPPGEHFGLRGMHEWAEAIGGQISIESGPNKGTKISLTI